VIAPGRPDLSVVVVTPDDFRSIARVVGHLRGQTVHDRIELLIVAPSAAKLGAAIEAVGAGFQSARVIEHAPVRSRGVAGAAGARAARAAVVAFAENHSFPDPEWAESFLEAHRGPWAVVGPSVRNANPETQTSRVNFALTYGGWSEPAAAGEVDLLPFHGSAYKREWLAPYGDRLGPLLDQEYWLQRDVRERGGRLYFEPRARTAHLNESVLVTSLRLLFGHGRLFGAGRSSAWSPLRRAGYVLGSPAIPLLNLPGALRNSARQMGAVGLAASLPSVGLHVAARAAGEAFGYLCGRAGDSDFLHAHEFSHRSLPASAS